MYTTKKRYSDSGTPTHIVKLDYGKIDLNDFYDFVATEPALASAHPKPPNSGAEYFNKVFRDISASNPKIIDRIMYNYWAFLQREDPLMKAFPSRYLESTVQQVHTTRVVIDPQMAEVSVRGTPARIISSHTESDNVRLLYYAQGLKFDMYAVEEPEGAEMYGLQMMNLVANMEAAIKHHIVAVAIQTTPSYYLAPSRLSGTLRVPETGAEFVYLWRQLTNIFGKQQKTMATILRMFSDVMARQNERPDRIIVPSSKFNVLFGSDRSKFLYTNSGDEAEQKKVAATGVILPGQVANLLGLRAIPTAASEINSGYDESNRVLTSSDFRTGSIFVHLKQFSMQPAAKQKALWDTVLSPSWYSNADDEYKYYNTVAHDISFIPPGDYGYEGPIWRGLEGLPNRPLLHAFTGMYGNIPATSTFETEIKSRATASRRKVADHFFKRRVTPPDMNGNDDVSWRKVSPLLAWNDKYKFLYPATVLGELDLVLSADRKMMELALDIFEDRLFEGVNEKDGVPDAGDNSIKYKENIKRITWAHSETLRGMTVTNNTFGPNQKFDEKEAWQAAIKELNSDFQSKNPGATPEQTVAAAISCIYEFMKDESANSTESQVEKRFVEGRSERKKVARKLYFKQPIGAPFFKKCHDNNIFVPFSGVIVRVSERSEATTPVLLAAGKVGESYVQPRAELMSFAAESKQGFEEMGVHVGGRVEKKKFMPLLFAITGAINVSSGGSGDKFMVEHDIYQNALGSNYLTRMGNINAGFENPALVELRKELLNRPENCDRYTNLAIFQGTECGKIGGFPQAIDISGRHHARSFAPYISPSSPLLQEQREQMFPGSIFHAWALDADKVFRIRPDGELQIAPDEMSYIQLAESRRNNTVAALADCLHVNCRGVFERRQGIHVRGERIPGRMREMDECNVYVQN